LLQSLFFIMVFQVLHGVVAFTLLIQAHSLSMAGYESISDVTVLSKLDEVQAALETQLKIPNFTTAKEIYLDSALQKLSTEAEDTMAGQAVFEKFKKYYDSADYANAYVLSALDGTGAFDGQEAAARVEGTKKGTAYMNVWMAVIGELEEAASKCSVEDLDEAVALYVGSKEGTTFAKGSGKMIFALADKRCKNFKTCVGRVDVGSSEVNTKIMAMFDAAKANIHSGNCKSAHAIKDAIVSYMTVPLIQGSLRYAYKVAELDGQAKEKGEGAVFAAAVLPLVADCSATAAATISDNMKIDAATPMKDGFAAVKTAFESTYSCLKISCEAIGGLLVSSTKYYPGAEPCATMIAGYTPVADVMLPLLLDLDQKAMEAQLKVSHFTNAGLIYHNGHNAGHLTLASLSTGAASMIGQKVFDKFKSYYSSDDYANGYVTSALEATGGFAGKEATWRDQGTKKGSAYMNVWMSVIGNLELAITECNVEFWDTAVALYTGSLEGAEFNKGSGKMIYSLADKRCKNFKTCNGTDIGSSDVNTEIFKHFKAGQAKIVADDCSGATTDVESIVAHMTIPLIQGSLRYAYKVSMLDGKEKEKAEGAVFSAAVLPLIHACSASAATLISDNMKIDSASPMSSGYAEVKTAFESTYDCLKITCAHIGGLLLTSTEYYEGAAPCGLEVSTTPSEVSTAPMLAAVFSAYLACMMFLGM